MRLASASSERSVVAGDVRAFQALVRRHHDPLWRLVWRLVHHSGQVEALVQQIFTDLRLEHPDPPQGRQLTICLYRIAVERSAQLIEFENTPGNGKSRTSEPGNRRERLLDSCHQSLSVTLRAPLCLKLEGLTYEEVADTLRLSVDTVRTRVFLARDAIAKCVARKRARHET